MSNKKNINDFNLKFPENFWWGAAASAPQTEGTNPDDGKSPSTWDIWYELEPELFFGDVGPSVTSNVLAQYKGDAKLMQDINMNSYRTSISWTRLLPDGKTLNPKAVPYYRDYFQALIDNGIEATVNLFHFDMPWWMMEKGGWENHEITDHFAYYAKVCIEEFGDLVKHWVTFNEPIVHVECSYLWGFHYPAEQNFQKAITAGYHTVLAHAKALQAMKAVNKDILVGSILNLSPVIARSDSEGDKNAAHIASLFATYSFLDPMLKGHFPKDLVALLKEHDLLAEYKSEDLDIIKNNIIDFLGVNYYQPMRVKEKEVVETGKPQTPHFFYDPHIWEDRVINEHRGWEIYPDALYEIAILIRDEYDNIPWFVSENGMGVEGESKFIEDGIVQDDYRIKFVQNHLAQLHKGIQAGSNCFGYHMWTFVDCWSWLNAYKNRYGFYSVDIETQKRTVKKSGLWFKDFVASQKD